MTIEWTTQRVKLGDLQPWARNPRRIKAAQARRLVQSFTEFGQVETLAIGPQNEVYNGHQRLNVLMDKYGPDHELEVRVADRPLTEKEREKLTVFLHKGAAGEWDFDVLANEFEVPELLEWGFEPFELGLEGDAETTDFIEDKNAKPNPRNLPIDVIYTLQGADCTCCLAVQSGLKYGIQSASYRLCPYTYELSGRHEVCFIDNDYFDYKHDVHLKVVKELRPKYATVRDIMTPDQCEEAGIDYYPLGQILDWAAELAEHAENVILIPKYTCLEDIPEQYVLGYSVPTSHGGTPLPPELFKGRRVHLLGGSWKAQLAHMAVLGDDVVSLDNNYVARVASEFGGTIDPDGNAYDPPDFVNNIRYTALAIAFGAMGTKVNELYSK
jgi:hypothetical protein